MTAALCGNTNKLNLWMLCYHLAIVCIAKNFLILCQALLRKQFFHFTRQYVAYCHQLQLVIDNGLDMIDGYSATANKCIFHLLQNLYIFTLTNILHHIFGVKNCLGISLHHFIIHIGVSRGNHHNICLCQHLWI